MDTLSLKNVGYGIYQGNKKNKTEITILRNVNLELKSGELMAVIGTSGSGKTSLLNIIGGRVASGFIKGSVKYNGKKRVPSEYRKLVSFVEQELVLQPTLTVKETLAFSTNLFHSAKELGSEEIERIIELFLTHFKLKNIEKSKIGGAGRRGISGGEKKLVGIANKLIAKPKILLLDEPTTGLDSNSTLYTISLLKKVTQILNLITISSIHQPSQETFLLFDKVIITSNCGIVYCGPTHRVTEYFNSLGYYCPEFENPVDYYLNLITQSSGTEKHEQGCSNRIKRIAQAWETNPRTYPGEETNQNKEKHRNSLAPLHNLEFRTSFDHPLSPRASSEISYTERSNVEEPTVVIEEISSWPNSLYQEFKIILKRNWVIQLRDPALIFSYLLMATTAAIFLGFTFFNTNASNKIQNTTGLVFLCCLYLLFLVALPLMLVLDDEKRLLAYERSYSMYRVSSFYFALIFTMLPIILISNFIMMIGTYFLGKFQLVFYKLLLYCVIYSTTIVCSFAVAVWAIAIFPTLELASVVLPLVLAVLAIFGGNLINTNSISPIISWVKYLSFFYYSYAAILVNEFSGLTFDCSTAQPGQVCHATGEQVLESIGFANVHIYFCILMNVVIAIVLYILAYFGFRFKVRSKFIWI